MNENWFILHNSALLWHLLWIVPLALLLFAWAVIARKRALRKFADANLLPQLSSHVSGWRRACKMVLMLGGLILVVIALARPAWDPMPVERTSQGREVVFLVDVSNSMLARDLAPNRLERAKLAIGDCLETLQGDRVALVAFAGSASVKCPLTVDYGFFRMALEELSPNSVPRGGTLIGDAIRTVMREVFENEPSKHRDIIIITDGGDQESDPVAAAQAAGAANVRILTIGLGDPQTGERVPVTSQNGTKYMTHQGREVISKMDEKQLQAIATASNGGAYLPVGTSDFRLDDIYRALVASAEKEDLETRTIRRYQEKYQIFLLAGFLLLAIETLIGERRA